jgi:hypothetical protein
MSNNVYYVGVARMGDQPLIPASFSYNTETDPGAVKQVLQQPSLNMQPYKHYTFSVAQLAWHLIADDLGLIYILICQLSYPQRCAHMCLEELQRTFVAKFGDKATSAKDRSLDKPSSAMFLKICQKYDNIEEVDKLAALSKKVDAVKVVMQENVDMALRNCVKLENIERQAEELQQSAGVFKRGATDLKNKMWWKNIKMKLIIAAIILVILGIIIAVAVTMNQGSKK